MTRVIYKMARNSGERSLFSMGWKRGPAPPSQSYWDVGPIKPDRYSGRYGCAHCVRVMPGHDCRTVSIFAVGIVIKFLGHHPDSADQSAAAAAMLAIARAYPCSTV
jgi:hypothetical protein